MNRQRRLWKFAMSGLVVVAGVSACVVGGAGYDRGGGRAYVGGVYETPGAVYGGWGPGYRVGPSRDDHARTDANAGRRNAPSIPDRPRDH